MTLVSVATLGLGQVVLSHPQERARLLPAMRQSAARLTQNQTNAFGTQGFVVGKNRPLGRFGPMRSTASDALTDGRVQ